MAAARPVTLTGNDQTIDSGPTVYHGFSLRNTSGAATATVRIWAHPDKAEGALLDTVHLAESESAREYYPEGVVADSGLYVEVVSGAVEGSVRVGS